MYYLIFFLVGRLQLACTTPLTRRRVCRVFFPGNCFLLTRSAERIAAPALASKTTECALSCSASTPVLDTVCPIDRPPKAQDAATTRYIILVQWRHNTIKDSGNPQDMTTLPLEITTRYFWAIFGSVDSKLP